MSFTTSTRMKRAVAHARKLNQKLTAYNKRFLRSTLVVVDDGSVFYTDSSFLVAWKDPVTPAAKRITWIFVIAEHSEPRVFSKATLVVFREFLPGKGAGRNP